VASPLRSAVVSCPAMTAGLASAIMSNGGDDRGQGLTRTCERESRLLRLLRRAGM